MVCPKCESDQWKLASLIYAESTIKTESLTLGGGGIVGAGGVLPGLGGGVSFGSQQTNLAKLAAPPEKEIFKSPRYKNHRANLIAKKGFLICVVGIFGLLMSDFLMAPFLSLIAALICSIGMLYLVGSIIVTFAGVEADQVRMAKAEAKNRWLEAEAKKMEAYEATRICMRCGHKYLPE